MQKRGVDKIFFAGTSLTDMVDFVHERYGKAHKHSGRRGAPADMQLARKLTEIEDGYAKAESVQRNEKSNVEGSEESEIRASLVSPGRGRGQDDAD